METAVTSTHTDEQWFTFRAKFIQAMNETDLSTLSREVRYVLHVIETALAFKHDLTKLAALFGLCLDRMDQKTLPKNLLEVKQFIDKQGLLQHDGFSSVPVDDDSIVEKLKTVLFMFQEKESDGRVHFNQRIECLYFAFTQLDYLVNFSTDENNTEKILQLLRQFAKLMLSVKEPASVKNQVLGLYNDAVELEQKISATDEGLSIEQFWREIESEQDFYTQQLGMLLRHDLKLKPHERSNVFFAGVRDAKLRVALRQFFCAVLERYPKHQVLTALHQVVVCAPEKSMTAKLFVPHFDSMLAECAPTELENQKPGTEDEALWLFNTSLGQIMLQMHQFHFRTGFENLNPISDGNIWRGNTLCNVICSATKQFDAAKEKMVVLYGLHRLSRRGAVSLGMLAKHLNSFLFLQDKNGEKQEGSESNKQILQILRKRESNTTEDLRALLDFSKAIANIKKAWAKPWFDQNYANVGDEFGGLDKLIEANHDAVKELCKQSHELAVDLLQLSLVARLGVDDYAIYDVLSDTLTKHGAAIKKVDSNLHEQLEGLCKRFAEKNQGVSEQKRSGAGMVAHGRY